MVPGTRRGLGVLAVAAALTFVASCSVSPPPGSAPDTAASSPASDAMGTQYDTTHVYVTPDRSMRSPPVGQRRSAEVTPRNRS